MKRFILFLFFIIAIIVLVVFYIKGDINLAWTILGTIASVISMFITALTSSPYESSYESHMGNGKRERKWNISQGPFNDRNTSDSKNNDLTTTSSNSSGSNPPLPPKSTGKTLFDITRIDRSDFIITVNFKSKDGLNAINDIDVSVGVRDICSIKNSQDFPIKSLAPLGQFYVELRRHSDSDRISDITIKCASKNGPWSEVRHIDVNKLIEAHYKA